MLVNILVIDDDRLLRKTLRDLLIRQGHQVVSCECLAEAGEILGKQTFDLIMLDMRLPDGNGLDFLREQKKTNPELNVVIITAHADVKTAVAAIKNGAFDYLPKPFEEEELYKIVRNAGTKTDLTQRVETLSELTSKNNGDMIIHTESARTIIQTAEKVSLAADTTVLILGESGTGKGLMAKYIHRLSPRSSRPFIDINCSAIPEQLMESELFGYERGAFTDAKNRKIGLLEAANGGSVFLDEIGDMSVNLQSKILKVIEEKEFRRLGSAVPTRVDIRIITATSRNLQERIIEGMFREDLYYRLSVVPIILPPLRERRECIIRLAEHYLDVYSRKIGYTAHKLSDNVKEALLQYKWPGNIRELCNVIERGVILAQGHPIKLEQLGLAADSTMAQTPASKGEESPEPAGQQKIMSLAENEKNLIETVLKSVDGNRSEAAKILQIHRTTLYKKIGEYSLG